MNPLYRSFGAALLSATLLAGCSDNKPEDKFVATPPETIPAATVTPGNESSLFPLDKGNQWTYTVQMLNRVKGQNTPMREFSSVWTVKDSRQTANGTEATIEASMTQGRVDRQKWRVNSKGIYQLANGDPQVAFNPAFPVIVFPVKDGFAYKWSGTGPNGTKNPGPQTSERTIRASQTVDTDMGRMSAIPVDDIGTLSVDGKKGRSTSTTWLAPGVGIVRMRQEVVVGDQGYVLLLKLKSKSLMKS